MYQNLTPTEFITPVDWKESMSVRVMWMDDFVRGEERELQRFMNPAQEKPRYADAYALDIGGSVKRTVCHQEECAEFMTPSKGAVWRRAFYG